jgi:hypothetical protein
LDKKIRIVTFTLLFISKNFSFNYCNIIQSGLAGRVDVPSSDGIPKIFFLQEDVLKG